MHRLDPKYSRDIVTPHRHVRTRLYFTSESHIHTMVNAIRYGNLCDDVSDEFWKRTMEYFSTVPELNYMTQIILMLYEDPQADKTSDKRFHIELHFSPGVKCNLEEAAAKTPSVLLEPRGNDSFDGAEVNADSKKSLPTAVKRRPRSDSDDEVVLRVLDKSWQERRTAEETNRNVSPRRFGNRSLSECDSLKPGVAENRGKYKAISKSLESVTIQKESKSSCYPIQTSLSDELQDRQTRDHLEEHSKNLRVTISSPTLLKTQRGASSLIAALGPVFSVPGVRKLALRSAVPMANVVARQKLPLPTDERFLPQIPDHQVHSVLSSIHPVKTLHGCIPLRQMENFLKEISNFHAPELTPDLQKRRMAPKGLQLKPEKKGSPMARDLAASIPRGEDGIDMAEFECCENYAEKVTTV